MKSTTRILTLSLFALALAACNRHKNAEPAAAPAADNAQVQPAVPVEPPKVNEPPPVVHKDSATQKLFSGDLQPAMAQPVSGSASILKSEDGFVVRIEGLHIADDAPELDVVLSKQTGASAADIASGLSVGEVKGATGNMNYPLKAGTDINEYHTLLLVVRGKNQVYASASFGLM
jgi:hypothetical protein